jgi:hypothetical protein
MGALAAEPPAQQHERGGRSMSNENPRRGQNTAGAVEGKLQHQIPISPSPLFQPSDAIAAPKIRNGVAEKTATTYQWANVCVSNF